MTRRLFGRITARWAAAASLAAGNMAPWVQAASPARPRNRANNAVHLGCIGTGPQGMADMQGFLAQTDVRVVAVCDVKEEQRRLACEAVNRHYASKDCAAYEDFRELLQRSDLDAVLIATPDHWHVLNATAALHAGKDVYMEKPMGCSIAENRILRDAVRRSGRVFQFGTQQRSDRNFRLACELVRNGRIGTLQHIDVWAPGSAPGGSTRPTPPPSGFNYDLWLGPAPFRPHAEDRCAADSARKTWWFESDYTLGFIAGWGIHPMDIACWGAGSLLEGRVEIEGSGHYPTSGACDTATSWDVQFSFASGVTLTFAGTPNGGNAGRPTGVPWPHLAEWRARYGDIASHGTAFVGTEGWILVSRGKLVTHPESLSQIPPGSMPIRLKASAHHGRDFIDCIRSRATPVCPVDEGARADALCQVADIAARRGRRLAYDTRRERFAQDADASSRLHLRTMRDPWRL